MQVVLIRSQLRAIPIGRATASFCADPLGVRIVAVQEVELDLKELFGIVVSQRLQWIQKLYLDHVRVGFEVGRRQVRAIVLIQASLRPSHLWVDENVEKLEHEYRYGEHAEEDRAEAAYWRCKLPLIFELQLNRWSKFIKFA